MVKKEEQKKEETWLHAIFVNPWGLPLIIPFTLFFIYNWIAFPLLILWGFYFIWVVRESDPMYKRERKKRK